MKVKYLQLFLVLLFSYTLCAEPGESPSYTVYDYTNQTYISELNKNTKYPLEELSTIMVLYIVFEELAKNRISIDTQITIDDGALSQVNSRLFLTAQNSITVEDAIKAIITNSANDVVYALAKHISGSIPKFTKKMNKKAKELGMKDTNFESPFITSNKQSYSTASDINILVNNMLYNYSQYYGYFEYKNFEFENNTYTNSNDIMGYKGVDGIKASHLSNVSFWNIAVSYMINGRRIVVVNLGYINQKERTDTTKKIIDDVATKIPLIEHGRTDDEIIKSMATEIYYKKDTQKTEIETSETLETPEIDTSTNNPTETNNPKDIYKVQLGAYKYKSNADNKIEYIKTKYRYVEEDMVFVQNMKIENTSYYKPIISNLSKEQAEKICKYIKDNKDDCFVTKE